jgi:outer membrane lipoprotein SlyB
MMTRRNLAWFAFSAAIVAAGCSSMTPDEKKLAGQVAGGVTGAAVGSLFGSGTGRVVATGAGAVLGTVVGGKVAEKQ